MIILVVNAGSSSVKFTCFDMAENSHEILAKALIERIGLKGTVINYSNHSGRAFTREVTIKDTREAVKLFSDILISPENGVLKDLSEIKAIGHRLGHGGDQVRQPVLIDESIKEVIRLNSPLAPLHHKAHLAGVLAAEEFFPGVSNTGLFDTSFHAGMPPRAYLYAIPYELYAKHKIRRYGFHGTSCAFVLREAVKLAQADPAQARVIVCHLGSGASISAVKGGVTQDSSMGLTPLEGLVMGTRSGDIDPGALPHIMKIKNLDAAGIDNFLNRESGLLGLAGIGSSDLRDIEKAYLEGHQQCGLALEVYVHRVKKYIGAYLAVMGGLDILTFTAGVGENSATMRRRICEGLEGLGLILDQEKNERPSAVPRLISQDHSPVKIMVVPTNEELEIALRAADLAPKVQR